MTNNHDWKIKLSFLGWRATFPQKGEACSGVLVESSEGGFLLDCGCGTLIRLHEYTEIHKLEGVALSHLHFDHMSDLGSFLYMSNNNLRIGKRKEKLRIFAPETPVNIRSYIEYPYAVYENIKDGMKFSMAGINITAMKVKHPIECYSFRLEREGKTFVYLTDTIYLPEAADFIRGADLLICEATNSKDVRHSIGTGHMSDREAGITAREGKAKRLCLYHLPSDGDWEYMRNQAREEFGGDVFSPDLERIIYL